MPAPILNETAKIFPDEILRKIVSYVPNKTFQIQRSGLRELIRRLRNDEEFQIKTQIQLSTTPKMNRFCSFRFGENRLKTPAAMTYEDPWYGTCHLMILNRQNKNNPMEFQMTQWIRGHFLSDYPLVVCWQRQNDKIFLHFQNGHTKTVSMA